MYNYISKINFHNDLITSLAKNEIDNNNLQLPTPAERSHLENRLKYKHNEITRRFERTVALHGSRIKTFVQYSLVHDIKRKIIDELPIHISVLNPQVAVQVITGGQTCTPHKDHSRTCSMFYLYTEPNVKTSWWTKTENFEEFDDYRYGDPDKLKEAHSEIIEPHHWYVFNNSEFHSIHRISNNEINRICLIIEFTDIPASELYKLFNND
jgi:hypothetical protein